MHDNNNNNNEFYFHNDITNTDHWHKIKDFHFIDMILFWRGIYISGSYMSCSICTLYYTWAAWYQTTVSMWESVIVRMFKLLSLPDIPMFAWYEQELKWLNTLASPSARQTNKILGIKLNSHGEKERGKCPVWLTLRSWEIPHCFLINILPKLFISICFCLKVFSFFYLFILFEHCDNSTINKLNTYWN